MISRLPHAQLAVIDPRKITDYLLASTHPVGRAKVAFFGRFGFTAVGWPKLRTALIDHANSAASVSAADTLFGRKYILKGALASPDGRNPRVRAIWFIATGETAPKFVTAYPVPGVE